MADETQSTPAAPKKFRAVKVKVTDEVQAASVAVAHQHGPGCNHDHGDHDHSSCGHSHHGHDHAHAHGGGCCGHDHDHGHGHSHGPPQEAAVFSRAAEDGGTAVQFVLAELIPGETDEIGRTDKLVQSLGTSAGVLKVHVRRDTGIAELCVHYDGTQLNLEETAARARMAAAQVSARYRAKTWFVRNMESAQCGYAIEHVLNRTKGVLQASVAYASERLVLEYDTTTANLRQIETRVSAMGYQLEEPEVGHACSCHAHGSTLAPLLEMPLVAASGMLLLLGGLFSHMVLAGPAWAATACYVAALLCGGFFPVRGASVAVMRGMVDIEALMVLAGVGAGLLGKWFEGAFLLFLFSLGHALEHRAMEKARRSVAMLGEMRPETALRKQGDNIESVPTSTLRRGERVLVRPGDKVPVDGIVREGQSSLNQATITGESMPVNRGPGDQVYAGTINIEGSLEVEVSRLASESVLARVVDMVADAEARKGPAQLFARRVEKRFVPIALALAPIVTIGWMTLGHQPFADAVLRGISVLVAASPCALAISTPAAVLSAVARAARSGVLIKGGSYLETLGRVDVVAFDKTGTLTQGTPKVVGLHPEAGVSEGELLAYAAALEKHSSHPLGKAVLEEVAARGLEELVAQRVKPTLGKGLEGTIGNDLVRLGSLGFFAERPVPDSVKQAVVQLQSEGRTAVVVQRGEQFLGTLALADVTRPDARAVIARLGELGVRRTLMLSGDNQTTAQAVAREVGIDEARAPLMPEGKVQAMRELAKESVVAMAGDGVNDAPALASASVGIAMGGAGSDVALETADVVLMGDRLTALPFAIELARASVSIIRQNLTIALGVSGLLVLASAAGRVEISEAVILHEGSTVLVVLNGLRLLAFRERPLKIVG